MKNVNAHSDTATRPALRGEVTEWLPAMFWGAVIFTLSTSYFSMSNTALFIEPILRFLMPGASAAAIACAHNLVRKGAHFGEYVILFWLMVRGPMARRPHLALAICAVYALLDEGHQIVVPGRTASFYDVGLDFSGALFSRYLHLAVVEIA
ncbi:MAG: VanZ family protein [Candidatus Binataceae bacterium]